MSKFVQFYTAVVAVTLMAAPLPGCHSLLTNDQQGIDSCPPWYFYNGTSCVCGDSLGGLVTCDATHQVASLLLDYCMTFNNNTSVTMVFYCPYNTAKDHNVSGARTIVLNTTVEKLNHFTCSPLRREGIYCERCQPNYGPSVFTEDLSCHNCSLLYSGWALYLTLEYFPLTVFFFIILITGISPRSGNLNSFVLLSQLISLIFEYGNKSQLIPPFGAAYRVVVLVLRTCYGFWNLDFFRGLIPGFCVSPNLSNLQVISLHFIQPFYPIFLLTIGTICILLHQRNFRPFVRVWKPFRRCLSHYPVPNDLRCSLVNVFVTFYLFGYTRILATAVMLLVRGKLFRLHHNHTRTVLLNSPEITYFSIEHAPYAFLAVLFLIVLIILPAVYLVLSPLLERKCSALQRFTMLQMTAHSFSSCFRDGKDGKMDCRQFAGGYLLLRIFSVMLFGAIWPWSPGATQITLFVVFGLTAAVVALCRPYRRLFHNVLDVILYALFALGIFFAAIANFVAMSEIGLSVIVFIALTVPLMYATVYIIVHLVKLMTRIISCSCKKRRQYEDISRYDDDLVSSQEHGRRSADYQSFQNE